jgi:hypothetical protein
MGRAITLLHDAFVEVQGDGAQLLEENFIMKIFSPLYKDLPEFEAYMDYYKEEKEGKILCPTKAMDHVLAIDEAISELFYPTKKCNQVLLPTCFCSCYNTSHQAQGYQESHLCISICYHGEV